MKTTGAGVVNVLLGRAHRYLAGGSLGMFRLPEEVATVFDRGGGSRIFDVTGREYIDFVLGSGSLILGHAHPAVVAAVQAQVARGSTFYGLNEPAIRLAERIVSAAPCGGLLRFTSSGTEATFSAIRLARAATGREGVLKFEGGWHGGHDYAQQSATPRVASEYPLPQADSAGIPAGATQTVLIAPFNDSDRAVDIIRANADRLAAVIVEPLQRAIPPKPGFLEALRRATSQSEVVFIFDEVVTGFRLAWGGAQERYGVIPDLAAYGKTVSGGYPLAAVCGKTDIMGFVEPSKRGNSVFISGTANGNPVSATAGLATLEELAVDGVYPRLYALSDRLRKGLEAIGCAKGLPLQVIGEGPVLQPFFTESSIGNYADTLSTDCRAARRFAIEWIRRGVFVTPGGKIYISLAHSDDDIDRALEAAEGALDGVKRKESRREP